jgi:tetratricopeptide (TPR) repeat protein
MASEWHLSEEQLASLVEGDSGGESALLREHLRKCPDCAAAFEDVARYRAVWMADASVFRASDDLVAMAKSIPARGAETATREPLAGRSMWRAWAPVLGPAAVALVLVTALLVWQPGRIVRDTTYADLLPPLQQAVAVASMQGSILIPGGEASASTTSPMHRAGIVAQNEMITSALNRLSDVYFKNPGNPDIAHWLISGYLATGQLDNADVFVEDARRRFPSDNRFLVLEALVAYRLNDMNRAERLLQAAVDRDPAYGPALVNLGLVQYERGQWDSARRVFETVRTQFAGSPLEDRANALLVGLLNG